MFHEALSSNKANDAKFCATSSTPHLIPVSKHPNLWPGGKVRQLAGWDMHLGDESCASRCEWPAISNREFWCASSFSWTTKGGFYDMHSCVHAPFYVLLKPPLYKSTVVTFVCSKNAPTSLYKMQVMASHSIENDFSGKNIRLTQYLAYRFLKSYQNSPRNRFVGASSDHVL